MRRISLLLFLAGCTTDGDSGTSVGNPGKVSMNLGASAGYELRRAHVEVELIALEDCSGEEVEVVVEDIVDLLDSQSIELPLGTWCRMQLVTLEPLEIEGVFEIAEDRSNDFAVEIELGEELWLNSTGFAVDDNDFVLELGTPGWLAEAGFEPDDGEVIEPEDEDSLWLFDVLENTSSLYEDMDADGEIDEDERATDPVATSSGEDRDDDNEQQDTGEVNADNEGPATDSVRGCTTRTGAEMTPVLALLAVLMGTARRRCHADTLR